MYTSLLHAAAKTGEPQLAEKWFQEAVSLGLSPDTVSYTNLMEAHARAGQMRQAEKYFTEVAAQYSPTVESYSALINGHLAKANRFVAFLWFSGVYSVASQLYL